MDTDSLSCFLDVPVQTFLDCMSNDMSYEKKIEFVCRLDDMVADVEFTKDLIAELIKSLGNSISYPDLTNFLKRIYE